MKFKMSGNNNFLNDNDIWFLEHEVNKGCFSYGSGDYVTFLFYC